MSLSLRRGKNGHTRGGVIMMLTLIKQGVVKVLVGLGILLLNLAYKIDEGHMKEISQNLTVGENK